jgi:hypothetical protein
LQRLILLRWDEDCFRRVADGKYERDQECEKSNRETDFEDESLALQKNEREVEKRQIALPFEGSTAPLERGDGSHIVFHNLSHR